MYVSRCCPLVGTSCQYRLAKSSCPVCHSSKKSNPRKSISNDGLSSHWSNEGGTTLACVCCEVNASAMLLSCDCVGTWPWMLGGTMCRFFLARMSSNIGSARFRAGISFPWARISMVWLMDIRAMERTRSVSAGSRADSMCSASSAGSVVTLTKPILVPLTFYWAYLRSG